jgi:hypothetical protein
VPHPFAFFAKGWEQSIHLRDGSLAPNTIRLTTKGDPMLRIFAISSVLLISSASLAAQAVDQYHPQKFDAAVWSQTSFRVLSPGDVSPCPAVFKAQQGGMGDLVSVGPGKTPDAGVSQRIHLSAAVMLDSRTVVSASVIVHGLTPQSRVMPVESRDDRAQASRRLEVSFNNRGAGESAADMTVRGFSAVFSIDVDSITYADGSTWKSGEGLCRIVPDPMMLVSAR